MVWTYIPDRAVWVKGDEEVTGAWLTKASLSDVMRQCPGLLLVWWKEFA